MSIIPFDGFEFSSKHSSHSSSLNFFLFLPYFLPKKCPALKFSKKNRKNTLQVQVERYNKDKKFVTFEDIPQLQVEWYQKIRKSKTFLQFFKKVG